MPNVMKKIDGSKRLENELAADESPRQAIIATSEREHRRRSGAALGLAGGLGVSAIAARIGARTATDTATETMAMSFPSGKDGAESILVLTNLRLLLFRKSDIGVRLGQYCGQVELDHLNRVSTEPRKDAGGHTNLHLEYRDGSIATLLVGRGCKADLEDLAAQVAGLLPPRP